MALPPTIYRATLQLADVDRGCYEKLALTLARHPSETAERLVARLLAYALWYREGLAFSRGICAGNEPDLWSREPDGRVAYWVEVGLPETERLIRAARQSAQVRLLACGRGLPRWSELQLPRLAALGNLQVVTVAAEFVEALCQRLERSIAWELTVTAGTLYLTTCGVTLESPLSFLAGAETAR